MNPPPRHFSLFSLFSLFSGPQIEAASDRTRSLRSFANSRRQLDSKPGPGQPRLALWHRRSIPSQLPANGFKHGFKVADSGGMQCEYIRLDSDDDIMTRRIISTSEYTQFVTRTQLEHAVRIFYTVSLESLVTVLLATGLRLSQLPLAVPVASRCQWEPPLALAILVGTRARKSAPGQPARPALLL